MKDVRNTVIADTLIAMQSDLTADQLQRLQDVLYMQLNQYEVQQRSTEIVPVEDTVYGTLNKFIATKRLEGKSEKTLDQYSLRIRNMLETINKDIDQITTYDLRFYLADYQEKRHVTNQTLENIRTCIKVFFTWLFNEGFIEKNPADSLNPIKCEKTVRKPFSKMEMEKLRTACKNKRDRAILEFLYATGCRVSEVVSLDRSDIDWNNKRVTVNGKGNKQRVVYLDDVSLMYLQDYLNSRTDSDPCLFADKIGKGIDKDHRLHKCGIEYMLKALGKKAGVDNVHPHRFRRTLASNMIARGAAIQDVATILGHEQITTTQVYCYVSDESVSSTYRKCIA